MDILVQRNMFKRAVAQTKILEKDPRVLLESNINKRYQEFLNARDGNAIRIPLPFLPEVQGNYTEDQSLAIISACSSLHQVQSMLGGCQTNNVGWKALSKATVEIISIDDISEGAIANFKANLLEESEYDVVLQTVRHIICAALKVDAGEKVNLLSDKSVTFRTMKKVSQMLHLLGLGVFFGQEFANTGIYEAQGIYDVNKDCIICSTLEETRENCANSLFMASQREVFAI